MPVIVLCLLTSNKNHLFCLLVSNKSIIFAHVFIFSRQTKDTASGFNSSNVLVKSKIQNENYQINRLKNLKNTE